MRRYSLANMPTFRAPKHWRTELPIGSDLLEHFVKFVSKVDQLFRPHLFLPLRAQPVDHLVKPNALSITCRHAFVTLVSRSHNDCGEDKLSN